VLRVFHRGILEEGIEIHLSDDEAHHLFRVLRANAGEKIMVLNGQGCRAYAYVSDLAAQTITIERLEFTPPSKITLCPALLKNKAMDFLIREATAIGVAKIIPLYTQHSEVKIHNIYEKQNHWNHIAQEACKQSGNPYLPPIEMPKKLEDVSFPPNTFVAALRGNTQNIFSYQREIKNHPISILIGPEGDFSEQEYQYFSENSFYFIHLGKNILRAESAALYFLSVVDHLKE
jgi:16S rRNA (uracil1498-N3)-methyltransferase